MSAAPTGVLQLARMAEQPKKPPQRGLQYEDLLGGAARAGAQDLLQYADEVERVLTTEEQKRRDLEQRLQEGQRDRPIIPVREWIRNPYFVGGLASDEAGGLFPKLKEDLEEIYDGRGGLGYYEVVCGGATGWGKTSGLMKSAMLRSLYELSSLAVPQRAFRQMMENDAIVLVTFNVTEKKARDTLYGALRREVESIPYFKDVGFLPEPTVLKEMRFPRNIVVRPGVAAATGAVSENLVFAAMDEANKYILVEDSERTRARGETYDVAAKLHGTCFNRQRTRFMIPGGGGEMPRLAKLFVGSSAEYPDDFVERRTEQIRESKLEHAAKWYRYAEWETKPRHFYTLPWVQVAVSKEGGAEVVDDEARGLELEARGWDLHAVPGEHAPSFREAPELAVRELLGIATKAIKPFVTKRECIPDAFAARQEAAEKMGLGEAGWRHPFTAEVTTLRDGADFIRDYLCAWDQAEGRTRPRVSPGALRYAHFDLSENKCWTGFAVAHILDVRPFTRASSPTADPIEEMTPWIWADFYLRIGAAKDEQVDLASARSLVFEMARMGFRFGKVTYDIWNSLDSRQRLEEQGFAVDLVSMDRTDGPYVMLRRALYEGRMLAYEYEPLREELLTIESVRGKVLPAKGKSKDTADALAAVTFACETWGMQGREWESPDARMVLAPRMISGIPERARVSQDPPMSPAAAAAREAREAFGGEVFLEDDGDDGPRLPKRAPDIFTRTYGRKS